MVYCVCHHLRILCNYGIKISKVPIPPEYFSIKCSCRVCQMSLCGTYVNKQKHKSSIKLYCCNLVLSHCPFSSLYTQMLKREMVLPSTSKEAERMKRFPSGSTTIFSSGVNGKVNVNSSCC